MSMNWGLRNLTTPTWTTCGNVADFDVMSSFCGADKVYEVIILFPSNKSEMSSFTTGLMINGMILIKLS